MLVLNIATEYFYQILAPNIATNYLNVGTKTTINIGSSQHNLAPPMEASGNWPLLILVLLLQVATVPVSKLLLATGHC